MPELPEVHTTATILDKLIKGLVIRDVWSGYNSVFHNGKSNIKNLKYFGEFKKVVTGKKIKDVTRRGKNVLVNLSGNITVLIHMKMTGHLLYGKYGRANAPSSPRRGSRADRLDFRFHGNDRREEWEAIEDGPLKDPFNRFIRLVFTLSNGKHLAFSDMRKFAKVCYLPTDTLSLSTDLAHLGPEPLEKNFQFTVFNFQLKKRLNGKIKQVLMDQSLIAGIGNIYSDEALWIAGIHPLRPVRNIKEIEMKKLFVAAKTVLKKGIDFQGDSMSDYRNPYGEPGKFQTKHHAYRKTGKHCEKKGCMGTIRRMIVGGRSAHFCDTHQK
ncbi:MAG TPA: bifunctional DNA-formamidopyrimidine glycosylase/DNA-(apurinic or apyrimidinic site) lyase [Candidatus Paceibacterota bacterium]